MVDSGQYLPEGSSCMARTDGKNKKNLTDGKPGGGFHSSYFCCEFSGNRQGIQLPEGSSYGQPLTSMKPVTSG